MADLVPGLAVLEARTFLPTVRRLGLAWALVLAAAAPAHSAVGAQSCANSGVPGTPYEGFGSGATGGAGKPIYWVTTLADSGPGSLRAALQDPAGHRCIVFDVAGEIVLRSQIYVRGASVTVDGFTAPSPGITLRDYGISIWGKNGAHDLILRGLRIRDAGQKSCAAGRTCYDAIQIKNGASRVVIDRISSHHAADGGIDLGASAGEEFTKDVTIQWSIFSGSRFQSLLHRAIRVSMHHNLFIDGQSRNPAAGWDAALTTRPPDTVVDIRNNFVIFRDYGTLVAHNATANVVSNYYYSSTQPTARRALRVNKQGRAYAAGNVSGDGANVDASGTETSEFSAPPIATADACRAAYEVRERAGARGLAFTLDSVDSGYIAQIPAGQLPGCKNEEGALRSRADAPTGVRP